MKHRAEVGERPRWRVAAAAYLLAGIIVIGAIWVLVLRDPASFGGDDDGLLTSSPSVGTLGLSLGPPSPLPVAQCEPVAATAGRPTTIEVVAAVDLDAIGVRDPSALSYLSGRRALLAPLAGGELPVVTLFGDRAGGLDDPEQPIAAARVIRHGMLSAYLAWNPGDVHMAIVPVAPGDPLERPVPEETSLLDLRPLAVHSLEDVTVDADTGDLYVADGIEPRIVRIPFTAASQQHAAAFDLDASCELRVALPDGSRLGPIAVEPGGGRLFVVEEATNAAHLHELDFGGRSLARHDLATLGISGASAMVAAPRSDPRAGGASIYLAGAGPVEDHGAGRMIELTIGAVAAAPIEHLSLVAAVRTSEWQQPSPDPCGIAYDRANDRLIVTDPEIEELGLFAGSNVFVLDASRQPVAATLTEFTTEPSDVAVDPATGDYFVTDDSAARVYRIRIGPDGALGGDDDEISFFATDPFGSLDPDGLAVGQGGIFLSDGATGIVHRVTPGLDGEFNGVAPDGDDVATSFDTTSFGVTDPEAVTFDARRGTLYLVTDEGGHQLVEVTTAGVPLRSLDLGFLPLNEPSGLTIGPSSDDPDRESIYLVDRGADQSFDPAQNDGLLVEVRLEGGTPPNAVRNGGFEGDVNADSLPDGWVVVGGERVGAGEARSGEAALRLTADAAPGHARVELPLSASSTGFAFSGWVRAAPGSSGEFVARLSWHDAAGATLRSDRLVSVIPGAEWSEVAAQVSPPAGAVGARLSIEVAPSGVVIVDDIALAPIP